MREIIFLFTTWIARLHEDIIGINDNGQYNLTDKQLHFWVIGLFGMALILVLQPIFKGLAENDLTLIITWIYVFTLVLVITFAIELGQWYTGSGIMESEDVFYGITGFLVMFVIYAIIRGTFLTIRKMLARDEKERNYEDFYG